MDTLQIIYYIKHYLYSMRKMQNINFLYSYLMRKMQNKLSNLIKLFRLYIRIQQYKNNVKILFDIYKLRTSLKLKIFSSIKFLEIEQDYHRKKEIYVYLYFKMHKINRITSLNKINYVSGNGAVRAYIIIFLLIFCSISGEYY